MTDAQEGRDVSIPIRDAIIEYELRLLRCPKSANPTILERYRDAAVAQLEATDMDEEAVHDAFAIYLILRDSDTRVNILESYLSIALSPEEETWARWNLCDALAMARRYDELVSTHNAFLEWAQHSLDQDKLFWVMEDATQALGWFAGGYGDEWMQIFDELNNVIQVSKHNRFHRFQHIALHAKSFLISVAQMKAWLSLTKY